MPQRPRMVNLPRAGLTGFLLVVVLLVAACTGAAPPPPTSDAGGSPAPSVAPVASVAVTSPAASVEPPPSAAASAPAASGAAWPSGVPVLNPDRCPDTLPADAYRTADGMQIDGDDAFIAHVERALDLLKERAAAQYADVLANVVMIRQVDSFSGMCYNNGAYRVGEETAYAPGHPKASQVVWLAGTIVHDGCHRARYVQGLSPSGKDAEVACLKLQAAALRGIEDGKYFRNYVQDLVDTADDPASQYWTNPDRHW